jgi:hypothetical protein
MGMKGMHIQRVRRRRKNPNKYCRAFIFPISVGILPTSWLLLTSLKLKGKGKEKKKRKKIFS